MRWRTSLSLALHLALTLLLKFAALTGLWWCYVRDAKVVVTPEMAAQRMVKDGSP